MTSGGYLLRIFNCHSLTCHVQLHICFIYDDDKDYDDEEENISDLAMCYLCTGVSKFIMREQ